MRLGYVLKVRVSISVRHKAAIARPTHKMKWKFWIQEKLYCTAQEATVIVILVAIIILAHGVRIIRSGMSPFNDAFYAETDSLFLHLSARAVSLDAVDTVYTSFSAFQGPKKRETGTSIRYQNTIDIADGSGSKMETDKPKYADVELWVFKDTLEKPLVRFPLNINQASEKELQALPRIGPQMARRIVEYRTKNPFKNIRDLLSVKGIGEKTMDKLRPLVTVSDSTTVGSPKSHSTPEKTQKSDTTQTNLLALPPF